MFLYVGGHGLGMSNIAPTAFVLTAVNFLTFSYKKTLLCLRQLATNPFSNCLMHIDVYCVPDAHKNGCLKWLNPV